MWLSVEAVVRQLEQRGVLEHHKHDHPQRTIDHVGLLLGEPLPSDLAAFYQARIGSVGAFSAVAPKWNDRIGWRGQDWEIKRLQHARAAPLLYDGCGSLFGVDLTAQGGVPAVYFFDHEDEFSRPHYAAGSSLGAFLLLLAEHDQAIEEKRPPRWQLTIDPDIDKCPRAPAIWNAG